VQISPDWEKEQAIKLLSFKLALTTAQFKAKDASRTISSAQSR